MILCPIFVEFFQETMRKSGEGTKKLPPVIFLSQVRKPDIRDNNPE
jgi:hypothetical protein